MPKALIEHQGELADPYYKPDGLWEALGWNPPEFDTNTDAVVFSIDLDLFAFYHNLGPSFAWPQRIFDHQFKSASSASRMRGSTGGDLVRAIANRASLITIAREPDYCGGESDCNDIFERFNRTVFDNALQIMHPSSGVS